MHSLGPLARRRRRDHSVSYYARLVFARNKLQQCVVVAAYCETKFELEPVSTQCALPMLTLVGASSIANG